MLAASPNWWVEVGKRRKAPGGSRSLCEQILKDVKVMNFHVKMIPVEGRV